MKHLAVLLFLAFLVGCSAHTTPQAPESSDEPVPIFTRSCSLCRVYGKVFQCVKFTNAYTHCRGLSFSDEDTCIQRSGYFTEAPIRGCFIF